MSHSLIDLKGVQVICTSGLASTEEIDRDDDRKGDRMGVQRVPGKSRNCFTMSKKMK